MTQSILVGLAVCAFITLVASIFIWQARKLEGAASIAAVHTAMFSKLMMGAILSLAIMKFTNIDAMSYGMTVGLYSCIAFPMIAFMLVRKDMS